MEVPGGTGKGEDITTSGFPGVAPGPGLVRVGSGNKVG